MKTNRNPSGWGVVQYGRLVRTLAWDANSKPIRFRTRELARKYAREYGGSVVRRPLTRTARKSAR